MPIRPDRMKLYPGGSTSSKEWKAIRAAILDRAFHRCEGTPQFPTCRAVNRMAHPETGSRVVLTIAHMDHDEENADPENLRALCQRCHLAWDRLHHARNARATRRARVATGDLFGEGD